MKVRNTVIGDDSFEDAFDFSEQCECEYEIKEKKHLTMLIKIEYLIYFIPKVINNKLYIIPLNILVFFSFFIICHPTTL